MTFAGVPEFWDARGDFRLTSARITLCHLLFLAVAVSFVHAQDSEKEESESKANSSTAKKVELPADRVIIKGGGVPVTRAEFESTIGDIEPQHDPDKGEAS